LPFAGSLLFGRSLGFIKLPFRHALVLLSTSLFLANSTRWLTSRTSSLKPPCQGVPNETQSSLRSHRPFPLARSPCLVSKRLRGENFKNGMIEFLRIRLNLVFFSDHPPLSSSIIWRVPLCKAWLLGSLLTLTSFCDSRLPGAACLPPLARDFTLSPRYASSGAMFRLAFLSDTRRRFFPLLDPER